MPLSACHRHAPLADGVCATTLQIFTKFFKTPRFSANLARHQGHQDDSQMAPAQIRVVPLDDLLSGHENLEALLSSNLRETLEEQLEQGGDLDEYMINKVRERRCQLSCRPRHKGACATSSRRCREAKAAHFREAKAAHFLDFECARSACRRVALTMACVTDRDVLGADSVARDGVWPAMECLVVRL